MIWNGSWGHDQCYGAKLRNAGCGVVIPKGAESSIITGIVPSNEREYYVLEWDGKLAELNEWTTFRHKAYLLCNLHPPIRCRCCWFSSPRLYVSVSLCAFSPSLAPLFCVFADHCFFDCAIVNWKRIGFRMPQFPFEMKRRNQAAAEVVDAAAGSKKKLVEE